MKKPTHDNPSKKNPVHTPTPPQVMDPSQPPKPEAQKEENKKKENKNPDKNEQCNEKLTPSEEL